MNLAVTPGWAANAPGPSFLSRYRSRFAVADITVDVLGDSPESVDLGSQLLSFASYGERDEDIELQVEWSSTIEPSQARELFHSGCLWRVHEFGDGLLFDFTTQRLGPRPYKRLLVDWDFQHARVILNRECLTADDANRALEYPLDELLITHHLSLGRGVELHGCGLVRDGGESFLFVGHSGAGKSTSARLWTEHVPVEVLSDDRIIVRRAASGVPKQLAKSGEKRVSERATDSYQGVASAMPKTRILNVPLGAAADAGHTFLMHGTPWHGEAAFASPGRAPLRRIFLLEHASENRIERLSRSAAVGELLARSFTPFYQPRFVDPVLALLEEMADALPCYRFQFVPDQSAVERILAFHD